MQVVCSQGDRIQILREITYIKSHEMLNVVLKSKTFFATRTTMSGAVVIYFLSAFFREVIIFSSS